jgi:hypothetical protein
MRIVRNARKNGLMKIMRILVRDARLNAVSLNIASKGYFWWYLPQDVSRFYEKIIDLESDTEVRVERGPKLELNWGKDELSESDLVNTIMCYRFLPRDNVDFLNAYVTGISFLGKNDIHTPFEDVYLHYKIDKMAQDDLKKEANQENK